MSAPAWRPDRLDHGQLAVLAREYLMAGHLIDRAAMPQVITAADRETMAEVAIEEWMAASPLYTVRIQELLGIAGGDDIPTLFKGLQFDVGAPHHFLDFRYRIDDDHHGGFHLDHCGALLDVEPMGEEFVHSMCHDIEDPTFDATAWATNPRAQIRPVHRPPRIPADRTPHCEWTVTIDPDREPMPEPAPAARLRASKAAALPVAVPAGDHHDGAGDYRGPFRGELRFEDLSSALLLALIDELALQGHLLSLGFGHAVTTRLGVDVARDAAARAFIGVAGVTAARLRRAFDLAPDPAGIAAMLELHPALRPRAYVDVTVSGDGRRVRLELGPCPALEEPQAVGSFPTHLAAGDQRALDAMVRELDPRTQWQPVAAGSGRRAWDLVRSDDPRPEPPEVTLARFSLGADFAFPEPVEG